MITLKDSDFESLYDEAANSLRKRAHLLLHSDHQDKVQRLYIGMIKNSFVEPHYHIRQHQWEMFHVVEGKIEVKLYNMDGQVISQFFAGPGEDVTFVEFEPLDIHSVKCVSERALLLEIKEGPFDSSCAKEVPF